MIIEYDGLLFVMELDVHGDGAERIIGLHGLKYRVGCQGVK